MAKVKANCIYCGKEVERFPSQIRKDVYCSKKCYLEYRKENNSVLFKCEICGKETRHQKVAFNKSEHHYCSYECARKGFSIYHSGENAIFYGCSHSNEIKNKISISRKGKACGVNNPSYNPNLTDEDREERRKNLKYTNWRKEVFERDNYTCQITQIRGCRLVVHHLNSFHSDKEHRTDINNGITVSYEIHKLFHKEYGHKNNTKEQFEEFKIRYYNGEFKEA
jgi:endogenous inhibitor of DNA gyrase (YacG/DUF329 family)